MPCFHPVTAWRSRTVNKSGKRSLVFKRDDALPFSELQVPCNNCIGCRIDRSKQWALRCVHEASLHRDNCFITLTYAPEHLPATGTLLHTDFQKFMKRLRKRFSGRQISYYMCGEYGEQNSRPHYHACIFNFDFPDKELYTVRDDVRLYTSKMLNDIWGLGMCTVGDVTFDSAAYVARYIMKKITGESADEHYISVDPDTGECHKIRPEYCIASNRPAVGLRWFEQYKDDLLKDYVTAKGVKMSLPKYYDKKFEVVHPEHFQEVKAARKIRAKNNVDNTRDRLYTRETVLEKRLHQLKREV